MSNLRRRIALDVAGRDWLNRNGDGASLHAPACASARRAVPVGAVRFDGELFQPDGAPSGFIMFASIHYAPARRVWLPGLPTKWRVLSLSRLWHGQPAAIQRRLSLPRRCAWCRRDGWRVHPPVNWSQPYQVRQRSFQYADQILQARFTAAEFPRGGAHGERRRGTIKRIGSGMDGAELVCFRLRLAGAKRTWRHKKQQRLRIKEATHGR